MLCQAEKINHRSKGIIFRNLLQGLSKHDNLETPGTGMCCGYKKLEHLGIAESISSEFKVALFLECLLYVILYIA